LGGYTITVRNQPTRSTQLCIPLGSLSRVPASAGVKDGMSPLLGGRQHCVIPYGSQVPVAVWRLQSANCYTRVTYISKSVNSSGRLEIFKLIAQNTTSRTTNLNRNIHGISILTFDPFFCRQTWIWSHCVWIDVFLKHVRLHFICPYINKSVI